VASGDYPHGKILHGGPVQRVLNCMAVTSDERQHEVAKRNWATAVQAYRTALVAYRRLVETRAQRQAMPLMPPLVTVVPPVDWSPSNAHLEVLTRRERDVAWLIARGRSNQQIANELVLTRGTVANHVAHILQKLGVTNRTQVAAAVLGQSPSSFAD
jgi:DNA-binding NarL/FixJ family response regulator